MYDALCAGKSDLLITDNYSQGDSSGKGHKSQGERAYFESNQEDNVISCDIRSDEGIRLSKSNKAFTLRSQAGGELQGKGIIVNSRIRRLLPIECERLQTFPDFYTNHVSDSQRYRQLGNSWTVDIVAHIFSYIK